MSVEENKALIRRGFEELINQDNTTLGEELLAPDYINYGFPGLPPGPAGMRQAVAMFRTAFPDFHVAVEAMIAEGDEVATRGTFTGTHQGEFMGIPATGKHIRVGYIDIWRLVGGKAVENWVQMDLLGLMQQLGVVPVPARAG